jgi:hypothetical protein
VAGSAPPPVAAGGGVFTPVDGSWGIHVNGCLWLMDVCPLVFGSLEKQMILAKKNPACDIGRRGSESGSWLGFPVWNYLPASCGSLSPQKPCGRFNSSRRFPFAEGAEHEIISMPSGHRTGCGCLGYVGLDIMCAEGENGDIA